MTQRGRLVVIGQGYVGLPLALRALEVGYEVVGLDLDQRKTASLNNGISYIGDVSDQEIKLALASGRYRPSSDYEDVAGFDFAIVTVPTPLKETLPDLSFIEAAVAGIAPHVTRGSTIVLESTTYPGTTEELVAPVLSRISGLVAGDDFMVGYSPERIDPGNPIWNLRNTPKVVSGIDPRSRERVNEFYLSLVDRTVVVSTPREAELAKLLENTFRHVNIALVNEIAMFANQLDIDVWEAIDAAATKPFGFMKFTPGPGVGGHCLPVDPSYLSWRVRRKLGQGFRFIELANDINGHMPDYVVQRLIVGLNRSGRSLRDSQITMLGLAYKKNTSDLRESPSLRIIELLRQFGASIVAVDPHVDPAHVPDDIALAELSEDLIRSSDAVLILTAHDLFDFDMVQREASYVLDAQHVTSSSNSEAL